LVRIAIAVANEPVQVFLTQKLRKLREQTIAIENNRQRTGIHILPTQKFRRYVVEPNSLLLLRSSCALAGILILKEEQSQLTHYDYRRPTAAPTSHV
jgi:hypothetical protein